MAYSLFFSLLSIFSTINPHYFYHQKKVLIDISTCVYRYTDVWKDAYQTLLVVNSVAKYGVILTFFPCTSVLFKLFIINFYFSKIIKQLFFKSMSFGVENMVPYSDRILVIRNRKKSTIQIL